MSHNNVCAAADTLVERCFLEDKISHHLQQQHFHSYLDVTSEQREQGEVEPLGGGLQSDKHTHAEAAWITGTPPSPAGLITPSLFALFVRVPRLLRRR